MDALTSLASHLTCGATVANLTLPSGGPSVRVGGALTPNPSRPVVPAGDGCDLLRYWLLQWEPHMGRLAWGGLKGLLRGEVLYTPDNPVTRSIVTAANKTFDTFHQVRTKAQTLGSVYSSVRNIKEYTAAATTITNLLSSEFYMEMVDSNLNEKYTVDLGMFEGADLRGQVEQVEAGLPFMELIDMFTSSLSCMEANRFVKNTNCTTFR